MTKDPYRYFRIEAAELLDQLAKGALDLEKGEVSAALVMRLLRLAHTLKGAARVVKQTGIAEQAHNLEDTLSPYRDGAPGFPREQVDKVLTALDTITASLAQLPAPAGVSGVDNRDTAVVSPKPGGAVRIVRADLVEVDVMLEGLSEIGNELGSVRRTMSLVERARALSAQITRQHAISPAQLKLATEEMHSLLSRIGSTISAGMQNIDRELREVRDAAGRLRLVPISGIFNTLERTARDAAHSTGKQVEFVAMGGTVRIEGTILDTVQNALIQIVRNAVAHGIETKAQRESAGKLACGKITIEVERRGNRVWFRCADDGAGVDIQGVRRTLQKKGLTPESLEQLSADALMTLLLDGGISTTSVVTEIAGRGIGLDLVREAMLQSGGEVQAKSLPGQGTTFELTVPVSLAAFDVLIIGHEGYSAAIPLDAIFCTLRVAPEEIIRTATGKFILFEGKQIPLVALQLGVALKSGRFAPSPEVRRSMMITAVVIRAADTVSAIAIEQSRGIANIVLRTLPDTCPVDSLVLGVYLDEEGNPCMVLDPEVLAAQRWSPQSNAAQSNIAITRARPTTPILIIDDSLTTRMLESSILESAGYTVELAVCAEDGLEMARNARYALFLVDVEMPGMDGFSFMEKKQADPALRDIPGILVSSRDAREDRQRGLTCGARAYIVKGEFDQSEFLRLVSELVRS